MTWVKVCGLTDAADVAATIGAGADAVGFVNIPASPRYVTKERALELAAGLPVVSILLTIDFEPDEAVALVAAGAVDGVQPYGRQAMAAAKAVVEAGGIALCPLPAGSDLEQVPGIPLLDTPSGKDLGGTGKTFDWAVTKQVSRRFVLAGGLGPDNVAAAVEMVRPWGVDASSRLELSPGRKDPSMVASFVERAKGT